MTTNTSDAKPSVRLGTTIAGKLAIMDTVSVTFDAHPVYGTAGTAPIAKATAASASLVTAHAAAVVAQGLFVTADQLSKSKYDETAALLEVAVTECRQVRDACTFEFAETADDPSKVGFVVSRYKTEGTASAPRVTIPESVPEMLILLPRMEAVALAGTYDGTTIEAALDTAIAAMAALEVPHRIATTQGQIASFHRAARDEQISLGTKQLQVLRDFGFVVFSDDFDQLAEFGFVVENGTSTPTTGDMDGDGIPDELDDDTDGDGIPNVTDTDDDNDGTLDVDDDEPIDPDVQTSGVVV